jgi:hypothetical protein
MDQDDIPHYQGGNIYISVDKDKIEGGAFTYIYSYAFTFPSISNYIIIIYFKKLK